VVAGPEEPPRKLAALEPSSPPLRILLREQRRLFRKSERDQPNWKRGKEKDGADIGEGIPWGRPRWRSRLERCRGAV